MLHYSTYSINHIGAGTLIKNIFLSWIFGLFTCLCLTAQAEESPSVACQITLGTIELEVNAEKPPVTMKNFLRYVEEGFMIQGDGFNKILKQKRTHPPIKNEADNGLSNLRGTLAMARTSDSHSATVQFFINTVDNPFLDHSEPSPRAWGHTVFGRVVEGMDVADKISSVPTGVKGPFGTDVPQTSGLIEKAYLIEKTKERSNES